MHRDLKPENIIL